MSNSLPQTGFIRLPQILAVIPVGKSTWWARVKSGAYPSPIKLGVNTTVWKAEDIHALIAKLANGDNQS
ncbi:MAG TPA: AlpA family phage regulatory protein [Methylotenera sp.]|nr:AlpA family phage regulatory protein [Methylotenera sp.]HPH04664.1 AlpA family phage regulatory protein [Methylotenera sp.]HPN01465.1 AlpA family phage regulatory protein [Methylotenera sp.]